MSRDLGDFQTPAELCAIVVDLLGPGDYRRVLEPTCGAGSFLASSLGRWPDSEAIGVELQESYLASARSTGADIIHASLFDMNLADDLPWTTDGRLLVIGNPPWVTNSKLGSLGSINLPRKSNVKNLKGLDAITGSANFDITEFMVIKLIVELMPQEPTVAMLCKTQVARNVFEYCCDNQLPVHDFEIFPLNAKKWFGAAVDACLFTFAVGQPLNATCETYTDLSRSSSVQLGFVNGQLVTDLRTYESVSHLDGQCQFTWRQGLKHDASSVMELELATDGTVATKAGVSVDIEAEYVFPLLKCTALHRDRLQPAKAVVVPQRQFGEETSQLRVTAPRL